MKLDSINFNISDLRLKNYISYWVYPAVLPLILFLLVCALWGKITSIVLKYLGPLVVLEPTWWLDGVAALLFITSLLHGGALLLRKKYIISNYHKFIIILFIAFYTCVRWIIDDYAFTPLKICKTFAWIDPMVFASVFMFILNLIPCLREKINKNRDENKNKKTKVVMETDEGAIEFLTDRPIEKCSEDKMGFSLKVEELVSLMQDDNLCSVSSYSIAVVSEWGTGKSSFMNMVKSLLREKYTDKWIIVDFNPRNSYKTGRIQEDFLKILRQVLSYYHSGVSGLFGSYIRCLEIDEKTSAFLKVYNIISHHSPDDAHEIITAAIKSIGMKIAVFIDDFDRLEKEEMMEVFKLISKNASFPNIVFVTGYDQCYVSIVMNGNNNICSEFDNAKLKGDGHTYVVTLADREETPSFEEKYFNKEFKLMVSKDGVKLLYEALLGKYVDLNKRFKQSDRQKIDKYILSIIDNPRELKRYVNILLAVKDESWKNVNSWQLALVLLLKYKYSEVYQKLMTLKYFKKLNYESKEYKLLDDRNLNKIPVLAKRILSELFSLPENTTAMSPSIVLTSCFYTYFMNDCPKPNNKQTKNVIR